MASNEQSNWFDTVNELFRRFCWCCARRSKRAEDVDIEKMIPLIQKDEEGTQEWEESNSVCLGSLYIRGWGSVPEAFDVTSCLKCTENSISRMSPIHAFMTSIKLKAFEVYARQFHIEEHRGFGVQNL